MRTLATAAALGCLALLVFGFKASPQSTAGTAAKHDWHSGYLYMKRLARRYHAQRDWLQRRLTVRVLEVRAQGQELRKVRRLLARRVVPDAATAIRLVFGPYGEQAIRVSSCETGGTFDVHAQNGQYLGLFQMGSYARGRYGHSYTALGQAQAAYRYFVDSGKGWGPWECKP